LGSEHTAVEVAFTAHDAISSTWEKLSHGAEHFSEMVEKTFKKNDEHAEHSESMFKSMFKAISLERVAEFAIDKLKELPAMLGEFAEKGEKIGRTADKLGMSAEAFQRLGFAAHMADLPAETLEKSMGKLNLSMGQLHQFSGPLQESLKRLDPVLMHNLRSAKDTTEGFLMISDAIKGTTDPQKRAQIAVAAFGKAGQDMIPFLLKGKDGIEEMMKETEKYQTVLGDDAVRASGEFSDAQKKMALSLDSLGNTVMSNLLPVITPMVDKVVEWFAANKEVIATNITAFVKGFGDAVGVLGPIVGGVLAFLKDWGPAILAGVAAFEVMKVTMMFMAGLPAIIGAVNAVIFAFTAYSGGAATAMEALNIVMEANPIGLIVLAVAGLVAGIVMLVSHWKEVSDFMVNVVGPVFLQVGQTIMKYLLLPVNLVITALTTVLDLASSIPGIGDQFKQAAAGMRTFQDGMNSTLTGTKGATDFGGIWAPKDGKPGAPGTAGANAPNAAALAVGAPHVTVPVTVNNERAPGTKSSVAHGAPELVKGAQGDNP